MRLPIPVALLATVSLVEASAHEGSRHLSNSVSSNVFVKFNDSDFVNQGASGVAVFTAASVSSLSGVAQPKSKIFHWSSQLNIRDVYLWVDGVNESVGHTIAMGVASDSTPIGRRQEEMLGDRDSTPQGSTGPSVEITGEFL
jgi:hypothetical protein